MIVVVGLAQAYLYWSLLVFQAIAIRQIRATVIENQ